MYDIVLCKLLFCKFSSSIKHTVALYLHVADKQS